VRIGRSNVINSLLISLQQLDSAHAQTDLLDYYTDKMCDNTMTFAIAVCLNFPMTNSDRRLILSLLQETRRQIVKLKAGDCSRGGRGAAAS
jgi:hypothetical protein